MIFQSNLTRMYIPTYQAIEYNTLDVIDSDDNSSMQEEDDLQIYECHCGNKYFNQENYLSHQRNKHSMKTSETLSQRKTEPETRTKINPILALKVQKRFFSRAKRASAANSKVDLASVIDEAFRFVFFEHEGKCYSHPKDANENNLLRLLSEYKPIQESRGVRKTDNVFYEYCLSIKYLTNARYFKLILETLLILREYWNEKHFDQEYTKNSPVEDLPLCCNDLIENYLFNFALKKAESRESIKIIHNLFNWLYYNEYSQYVISPKEKKAYYLSNSE